MPRILLVDDDDLFRTMLRLTLVQMGHEVVEARNGDEGLALQQREAAEVLLTDLIMPEKEGLETILEFRRNYPAVKIIAMSGGGRIDAKDYLAIARQLGATRVLAKPFSNQALAAAISEVMEG